MLNRIPIPFRPSENDLRLIARLDMRSPWTWVATWFGLGFLSPGPGTWGSLGALPFGILIYAYGGAGTLIIATVLISALGWFAALKFEQQAGQHDSKMIVIDEVAGQWMPICVAGLNPFLLVLSFAAFRFFDITKIWPASLVDAKLKGPAGVMLDDIIAGLYAALLIAGLKYAGLG